MMANSRLLLALVGAASADVTVRFTADFPTGTAVTSTGANPWSNCAGGAYRAEALAASPGLRIDGGGVAAACASPDATSTCAQTFAAMGYDAWALNANDIASSLNALPRAAGSEDPPHCQHHGELLTAPAGPPRRGSQR